MIIYRNMKTYSDLLATNSVIPITVRLIPVGKPCVLLSINDHDTAWTELTSPVTVTEWCELLSPISIDLLLQDKKYTLEYETAVKFEVFVDNVNVVPMYSHLATYENDHNNNSPTNYLGFNGTWSLNIDRPFYHWLHQATNQGWLID